MENHRDRKKTLLDWWPVVSRYGGFFGVVWSLLLDHVEHPEVLVIFGGMMGLDQVVSAQKKRNENGKPNSAPNE
jgi:hypothetical protein